MHVIATAGHVDHGKSRLTQMLTGIDPDRLEEERRRGLTIDLGFAWLRLPSGREVGVVDVPGHERFIKNMLAGVGAVGVTLFVVAANEGWKPQSQEHLDILDLLGISKGVVAVTKSDLVSAERLADVTAEVSQRISNTSMASAPIVSVSAASGAGLDELVAEIDRVLTAAPDPSDLGRPRLWVDRVFTMRGSGTVVTGTLIDGGLEHHREVEILPDGLRARIRAIQTHRRQVDRIGPGNRTALNLTGTALDTIERGDTVVLPGDWRPTDRLLASIRFLPHLVHDPTERGAFKFYVGSAERDAEIAFLDSLPKRGDTTLASILLEAPVVLDWRDRFILRDVGRRETVGGGEVLEPHPRGSLRRRDPSLVTGLGRRARAGDRRAYLGVLVDEEGVMPVSEIRIRSGLEEAGPPGEHVRLPSAIVSRRRFEEIQAGIVSALREHHQSHPLDAGMPREAVRRTVDLDPRTFEELVAELSARGALVADSTVLRTPGHAPSLEGADAAHLLTDLERGGPSPPTVPELERSFDPALIRALVRSGALVQVSPDLVYPSDWIEGLKGIVSSLIERGGPMTVAAFRDVVGTTRKYAVPLLEYLDGIGFTRRRGDMRELGPAATPKD